MLDIKWISANQQDFINNMKKRGFDVNLIEIINLYEAQKNLTSKLQLLQNSRNTNSESIRVEKDIEIKNKTIALVKNINLEIDAIKEELEKVDFNLNKILVILPNILQDDVPLGESEEDNVVIKTFNIQKEAILHQSQHSKIRTHIVNTNNHKILDHLEILTKFNCIETEKTVEMSGSRFVSMQKNGAKLERALKNFILDFNIKHGFTEINPPYLVQNNAAFNAGQLPKFEEDLFSTTTKHKLIPTAEVPLVNLYANKLLSLNEAENPIRLTAHTPCFRSEAGSAGKDTKGLIRLHQFHKVELVSICRPEIAEKEHEFMLNTVEKLLQLLELPYQVMILCSKDTSHHSTKTYDIEVWFPSQNKYREISSISNCGNYQARRLNAKYKDEHDKNVFFHMLNGSNLPLGRTIAAIVENYMNYDENYIQIPSILIPYFGDDKIKL
ncbi:MAG: serine--tRNA ligase [Rickettsiales bacterium]